MATKKKEVKKEEKKIDIKKDEKEVKSDEKTSLGSIIELIAIIVFIVVVLVFFKNTVIYNIVILLLMLSVLIFVHELGHFIMAKKHGCYVYEFALGMGPLVLSFRRKGDPTLYSLRALPIGGYNQIAGETGEDDKKLKKKDFMCNKTKLQRLSILVAGVIMNFITAFIILFTIALIWGSTDQRAIVGYIQPDSPASDANIKLGDTILEVNGKKVKRFDDITLITALKNKHEYYTYKIKHEDGTIETVKVTPATYIVTEDGSFRVESDEEEKELVEKYNLDPKKEETYKTKLIGIGGSADVKKGIKASFSYAVNKFASISTMMVKIIGYLLTGKLSLNALSGPVGMYTIVETVSKTGIANILYLTAYLSINLGVINILPFPAFDGGHVLFLLIEAITRKKVNAKVENIFHIIGFILIFALMIIITIKDILRLF